MVHAAALLSLLIATSGVAAVFEADLFAPGDGLLTRDPTLGLDWLDVDQTVGLSVDDILAGAGGWIALGFEHATTSEVCSLMAREVFAMTICGTLSQETKPGDLAGPLQLLLGITRQNGSPTDPGGHLRRTTGLFDEGNFANLEAGWGRFQYFRGPVGGEQTLLLIDGKLSGNPQTPTHQAHAEIGHYLVRPIPEPGAAALILFGLVGLAGNGRRQSAACAKCSLSD